MKARYVLRLDDACPTMDVSKWDRIEKIADTYGIKPLVAVIPENRDTDFAWENDPHFWKKVKRWQEKGWTIGLHGYEHCLVERGGGLMPLDTKSEFVGLSLEEQRIKIRAAWNIFQSHDITPTVWIAPAHTFDENTVRALYEETSIRIISDGIALEPYFEKGFVWVPQQLSSVRNLPYGTWTICKHPNTMDERTFARLERGIARIHVRFVSVESLVVPTQKRRVIDQIFSHVYFACRGVFKIREKVYALFQNSK